MTEKNVENHCWSKNYEVPLLHLENHSLLIVVNLVPPLFVNWWLIDPGLTVFGGSPLWPQKRAKHFGVLPCSTQVIWSIWDRYVGRCLIPTVCACRPAMIHNENADCSHYFCDNLCRLACQRKGLIGYGKVHEHRGFCKVRRFECQPLAWCGSVSTMLVVSLMTLSLSLPPPPSLRYRLSRYMSVVTMVTIVCHSVKRGTRVVPSHGFPVAWFQEQISKVSRRFQCVDGSNHWLFDILLKVCHVSSP